MKQLLTIVSTTIVITAILLVGFLWVIEKVGAADIMTWNEYQEYVSMLNYEIEKMGGTVTLQNVSSENSVMKALHTKIRSRAVEASDGRVRGKILTSNEYANKREILMQKAEAQL